jgi:hypothetical protein
MQWAHIVKSVGKALQLSYNYKLLPIALVTGLGGVHDFGGSALPIQKWLFEFLR